MAKLRDICKDLYMGLKERHGESNRTSRKYQAIDDNGNDKPHRWWIDRHYEAKEAERRAKKEANTHGSKIPAAKSSNKKSSGEHTKANDRKTPSQAQGKGASSTKPANSFATDRYYWSTSDEFLL